MHFVEAAAALRYEVLLCHTVEEKQWGFLRLFLSVVGWRSIHDDGEELWEIQMSHLLMRSHLNEAMRKTS